MNNLSRTLAHQQRHKKKVSQDGFECDFETLHLKMLRIQQGLWHSKKRAIILFEGFDAAGKGGCIRNLLTNLDPRSFRVVPVGPPKAEDQQKHYLYRFWKELPEPGTVTIFDRSWYGRVLAERVKKLTPKERWKQAYDEILDFETMLTNDGIELIKIFLAVSPEEQLNRFEGRLKDPYKQWKLTEDDLRAQKDWKKYVEAADDIFKFTSTKEHPWQIVPSDCKERAQLKVLEIVTDSLKHHGKWLANSSVKTAMKAELKKAKKKLKQI